MENKESTEAETSTASSLALWFNSLKSKHISLQLGPNSSLHVWFLLSSMVRIVGFWALGFQPELGCSHFPSQHVIP